jgi:hypothetical protein
MRGHDLREASEANAETDADPLRRESVAVLVQPGIPIGLQGGSDT